MRNSARNELMDLLCIYNAFIRLRLSKDYFDTQTHAEMYLVIDHAVRLRSTITVGAKYFFNSKVARQALGSHPRSRSKKATSLC